MATSIPPLDFVFDLHKFISVYDQLLLLLYVPAFYFYQLVHEAFLVYIVQYQG